MDNLHDSIGGKASPLGASVLPGGINFSVYSRSALGMDLLLFNDSEDSQPARTITLDPSLNRTHHYWHVFVPEVGHGQIYAWRVRGPHLPEQGQLFDGDKVLLDPYGKAVTGNNRYERHAAQARGDNCPRALLSVAVDSSLYDWESDRPLPRPKDREFIYEMHVAGFTRSPSSGLPEELRGTYAGLVEKIPYLKDLGITAVELMPVHHFDPQDAPRGLTNFWGYSSVSFFAPHSGFSSDQSPTGPVDEFRHMVKALHRAGIRVILDVVYNHTAEGGADGPTLSWRGFENDAYYILEDDKSLPANFTGCGNTINANYFLPQRMILDSLRYWVREMHVDGFRFDLASAMSRGPDGHPMDHPPVLWAIDSDPDLASTTMIAEAWDAAGLYQVGSFPGDRFAEWNGPFRDDVRRFLRGDQDTIENLMARIVGSPDLFPGSQSRPSRSINFVTSHDGFSLADLVAYEKKHNLENREDNRDGSNNNLSKNYGIEGPTNDPTIDEVRFRQIRNFLCLLFLAHGTPMLVMGDEVRHTRQGNNNPWCQDNSLNWFDWNLVQANAGLLRFTRNLMAFSRSLPILREDCFWTATSPEKKGEITWQGIKLGQPDWSAESGCLAYTLQHSSGEGTIHVLLNSQDSDQEFELPGNSPGHVWRKVIDTAQSSPLDIVSPEKAVVVDEGYQIVINHGIVVLQEIPIND